MGFLKYFVLRKQFFFSVNTREILLRGLEVYPQLSVSGVDRPMAVKLKAIWFPSFDKYIDCEVVRENATRSGQLMEVSRSVVQEYLPSTLAFYSAFYGVTRVYYLCHYSLLPHEVDYEMR